MKTICFYSIANHLGGSERSLLDLVRGIKKQASQTYEPWVLLPKEAGPLGDILKAEGIRMSVLPMPDVFLKISRERWLLGFFQILLSIPSLVMYGINLLHLLAENQVSLIHTTGIKCHLLAAFVQPWLGVPVLWHLRDIMRPGLTLTLMRTLYQGGGIAVIANSEATARAFGQTNGIGVIYNGLDPQIYRPARHSKYRERFQIPAGVPLIGMIGAFAKWKGQIQFIQMADRLKKGGVDARFLLIGDQIYDSSGDPKFKTHLEKEIQKLGLKDFVFFTGFEKDSAMAFNGLDIAIHASIRPEPFGRVVLEAMACGVPVAASAGGGVVEFLKDSKTGMLFIPGKVDEMTRVVSRMIKDLPFREKLAKEAHQQFLDKFTIDVHVKKVLEVYAKLLGA